jgi:hypothetical protein
MMATEAMTSAARMRKSCQVRSSLVILLLISVDFAAKIQKITTDFTESTDYFTFFPP